MGARCQGAGRRGQSGVKVARGEGAVTEFSNSLPDLPKAEKGAQHCEYFGSLPSDVGAAFSFVLSASAPEFAVETWREESGQLTAIPAIVGSCRSRTSRGSAPLTR